MKTRVISSLIGLAILFSVLAFFDTIVINIAVSVISTMSVYELLRASGYDKNAMLDGLCLILAFSIPFAPIEIFRNFLPLAIYVFIAVMFSVLIKYHKTIKFEQVACSFFFAFLVPVALTIFVLFRDTNTVLTGLYYVLMTLGASWITDTGAYLVGVNLGKHKFAPEISPKKTVEGAIGGVIICVISLLVLSFLYEKFSYIVNLPIKINYISVLIAAPIMSGLSMLGDLTASAIKRQYGIKDFGNIMPGHGGVIDRFDSVLMVVPAMYIASKLFPFVMA
ncbi:MAG: phosphatidate cytidylyltransferase [Oscillospiraceae bacterium]